MKIFAKNIAVILLSALCCNIFGSPRNDEFYIRHIGYADGLSSQRVFSIVEDEDGVMWFSTKTGIDRYNGRTIKNYSLPGEFGYGDKAGMRIWLKYDMDCLLAYTQTGRIYRYTREKDCFEQMIDLSKSISGEIILNHIYMDLDGILWAGLSSGLYRLESKDKITRIAPGHYINCIISSEDSILVGTADGILKIHHTYPYDYSQTVNGLSVLSLYNDPDRNMLWAGTFNQGLWKIDMTSGEAVKTGQKDAPLSNPVRDISLYDENTLMAGIDGGGVYAVDMNTGDYCMFLSTDDKQEMSLKGNGVYAVTVDHERNLWIGSYTGGVSVATRINKAITVYSHIEGDPQSIVDNNVNGITENIDGSLWFATDNGISVMDRSGKWRHALEGSVVMTFCLTDDGHVWAGTYGSGIYHMDSHGRILKHLTAGQDGLTTNYIFDIAADPEKNIWAGGLEGDLQKLDPEGNPICTYDIKWINSIQYAGNGEMSIATVDGIWMVNICSGDKKQLAWSGEFQDKNASAYIISALFNNDGTVWLATEGGGLILYNLQTKELRTFTTTDGMPSDDVYSVQKDASGRIWASTGRGIALLEECRIMTLNYMYRLDREYNKSSFSRLSDGSFIYGSTDGAICICPDSIKVAKYEAPLRFTGITVEDIDTSESRKISPSLYRMMQYGNIHLKYAYNSFIVGFEAINYSFQHDIIYQYKLEEYEREWNSSYIGTARYTNVTPGRYTLAVRSLRESDGSIISEKHLTIRIGQPWWNSWYAWILYGCAAGILLYFIFRYKNSQMQKRYDEDKIRFFIDTAHNIRTPVSLIIAPLDDLEKDNSIQEKSRYCLEMARSNANKLYTLISQLLDFEKADISHRKVDLTPVNLSWIVTEEAASFLSNCEKKQIELEISVPDENIFVMADRHLAEIICDNLLSNAYKYSLPHGKISFSLTKNGQYAVIRVEDNGIGIPRKDQKHIFRSVHRADNATRHEAIGTGFGLLMVHRTVNRLGGKISFRSEEGKGTVFTVLLKLADHVSDISADRNRHTIRVPDISGKEVATHDDLPQEETILIVEDHDSLRQYLHKTFEQEYRVVDVGSAEEAIDYLKKEYPDIILSDLMMPGIQGDDLCRMIKENPETSGIPFILLTARTNREAMLTGLKKGADDYIQKPFSTDILKQKVSGFIENRKRLREFFLKQTLSQAESDTDKESHTADGPGENISENDRKFVLQATHTVLAHISEEDFSINKLCQEMAISRTLFYNRIKFLTGQGPQEFIRLIRLHKAAELLKKGMSVSEVSTETGFANTKYFSILFKKQFGIQPSKYAEDLHICQQSNLN